MTDSTDNYLSDFDPASVIGIMQIALTLPETLDKDSVLDGIRKVLAVNHDDVHPVVALARLAAIDEMIKELDQGESYFDNLPATLVD